MHPEQLLVQAFAVFVMLGILSVLIIVHECGHFSVARFFGFQTPVFGFGLPFGPHWVVGKKWGTEFRVHACLLGGYVAIPELGDESNQDAFGVPLKPFRKFPIWQRALVAFAGVGFNILFAYLITVVMLVSLGLPTHTTVVGSLYKQNPIAAQAGIKAGDEITSIDSTDINGSDDVISYLTSRKSTPVKVHIVRDKAPMTIEMTTNSDGKVGMTLEDKGPAAYKKVTGSPVEIAGLALNRLWKWTYMMIDNLGQMFQGIFSGGKSTGGKPAIGIQDLHGVLAVIKIGSDIAQQDWSQLFIFTIMISMDLAIINLVPWPALDGGHLAFMFLEALRGRPMGERAQGEIVKWGFVGLMVLMVVIMANDVTALMSGKLDLKKKDSAKDSAKDSSSKDSAASSPSAPAGSNSDQSNSQSNSEKSDSEPSNSEQSAGSTDSNSGQSDSKP